MKRSAALLTLFTCLLLSSILLNACSLAENVTPPPNYTPEAPVSQPQSTAETASLFPLVQPDPANGAAIFADKCAPCHGTTGQGNGPKASALPNPATALSSPDIARLAIPSQWYATVTQGRMDRYMPPFSSLSESQRWDVVAYAYSLSLSPQQLTQGAQLYTQYCASCHGPDGKGDGPSAAGLNPAPPDLTQPEYIAQKSTSDYYQAITQGKSPVMPAYNQLSDQDRWTLADYVRSLSFTPYSLASAQQTSAVQTSAAPVTSSAGTPVAQVTSAVTQAPQVSPTISATQTISNPVGTVLGQITNGSGGQVPGGMTISLHGFNSNMQVVVTATATTAADGKYTFENIPMAAGEVLLASTDYQKTTYNSDVASIAKGTKTVNLDIAIFDTTTDQSTLSADRMHIFLDTSQPGIVQIAELYIISNSGNKTVVSSQSNGQVMKFTLPAGATNLQFQDGAIGSRYLKTTEGFADTMPIRPGQGVYQVLALFDLPYNGNLDLTQPIIFPVAAVVVLFPESNLSIKSSQLTDAGTQAVQEASYHVYNGGSLGTGKTLSFTLSGGGDTTNFISRLLGNSSTSGIVIGAGALGLALIAMGLVLYRRSLKEEETETGDDDEETNIPQDRESLMDAIIALDDLYKEGRLPEDAYQQRRAELKERLKKIGN